MKLKHQHHEPNEEEPLHLSPAEVRQKAYYNRIAAEYDDHFASEPAMRYRDVLFGRIFNTDSIHGNKVLDAMCGGGQNSSYFHRKGCHVSAIDISESQVEQYKKRYPGAEVICGSVLSTAFKDEYFDLIVTDSVHHLHPHITEALQEFHRILKPGGRLVMWEPSAGSLLDLLRKAWYKLDRKYFEENERSLDIEQLHRQHKHLFDLVSKYYGGNFGYLFVVLSMALRIPVAAVKVYARPVLFVERLISPLQTKLTSLWVLAEFRKKTPSAAPGI